VCPVYDVTRHERFSPRGKYRLITEIIGEGPNFAPEGRGPGENVLPGKVLETLKDCLQCGACGYICPAGVEINAMVRSARASYAKGLSTPWWLWDILRSRRLTSLLTKLLAGIPGTSGLVWRLLGLTGQTSVDEKALHFSMPSLAQRSALSRRNFRLLDPSCGVNHGPGPRIALFLGCVQNYLYPEVAEAMIRCLGGKVLVPLCQGCCGMPAWSAGAMETARELAIQNLKAFETTRPDFIVTGCAACASMIKEWPKLFSGKNAEKEVAINLADKVREFSQLVAELKVFPFREPKDRSVTVTYHAPCHQRFDLGGVGESEDLLDRMFSDAFKPMSHKCCGQGGLFSIGNPELAWKIFEKRLFAWERTGSSIVVTTCSGCLLQWRAGTAHQTGGPRVLHLAELIDNYYENSS
jgi:glycolate oxidase iron-sulfur subunit